MIRAVYDRKQLRLSVEGHANAGAYGRDPVCAGVSVLVQTLAASVQRLAEYGMAEKSLTVIKPGDSVVCCRPVPGFACIVRTAFDCICCGLELVAEAEPEHVSFTRV